MREHLFLNPNEYLTVEEFHLIRKMDLPQDFLDFLEIGFRTGLRLNDILNLKKENIDDILECLNKNNACLLVVPVKDTIKVCMDGNIVKTLPREQLVQAQTPQAFKTELIKRCYQKGKDQNYIATDDASLVEYFENIEVKAVLGSYSNIKITTPDDL